MAMRRLYICFITAFWGVTPMAAGAAEDRAAHLAEAARDCKAIHDIVADLDGNTADDTAQLYAQSTRLGDLYQGLSGLSDAALIDEMDAARARIRSLDFTDTAYRDMARACATDVDTAIAEARAAGVNLP
ncbi:hypothetical protein ABI_42460 [Asticcacaulis biprosthecium C19]|uniref:Uncharacterized protein n=1 Tax=Asticcacaulis biprosthecium C19 TaxID=715226 RepID=F4QSV3_9CAUL|nr:hypothetical protein [Asticcacaulis biprosthecium]EGF89823.1 hypothetical protein ABI_42460 [Asticcacaulis biprosthecium C19]